MVKWAREHGAGNALAWAELLERASKGDPVCMQAMERMMEYLEIAFANMANAYDTQCFIIGGDLGIYRKEIIERLGNKLKSRSFSWGRDRDIRVEASSFMGNASFIGTAALVLENNSEVPN